MGNPFARHSYTASERSDDTAVHDGPGAVFNAPNPHIQTAQAGIIAGVRSHANLITCSQNSLARGGFDRAFIVDIRADQHDAATTAFGGNTGADLCTTLNYNITVATTRRRRVWNKSRRTIATARHFDRREDELGIAIVEQTLSDKVVVDR